MSYRRVVHPWLRGGDSMAGQQGEGADCRGVKKPALIETRTMEQNGSQIFWAEGENERIAQSMEKARETFKYFWREMTWEYRRIIPGLEISAIKAAFSDPGTDKTEHMWLSDVNFDGKEVKATLLNAPNQLTSVAAGDEVTLSFDDIEDWMYAISGKVYGGFTVQAMRSEMSAGERKGQDQAWGLNFPPPDRVDLVPNWQHKAKKPGLFAKLLGSKVEESAPGDIEAEHPMSENMGANFAEAIDGDPEGFLKVGNDGLSSLHSLTLGGSMACVRVLLDKGANPTELTKHGHTARQLAETMGWPKLVELLKQAESRF